MDMHTTYTSILPLMQFKPFIKILEEDFRFEEMVLNIMMTKNKIKLTRERKSSKIKKQDNKKIKRRRKIRMQDNNSLKYVGENMVFRNIVDVSCGLLVRSCVSITLEKRITSSKGKPSGLLMARCTPVEVSEQNVKILNLESLITSITELTNNSILVIIAIFLTNLD
ncbi:hypothetical protein APICC_02381 [Apis cerana cerana]|uniref:Uncharacterized protein n=1 Tax=Apis cerana cerana TaxID=94128 RepID=A0A2A3EU30_APICC|nr:hypothetical protein APICC_02381 [Apis cerana cerana]